MCDCCCCGGGGSCGSYGSSGGDASSGNGSSCGDGSGGRCGDGSCSNNGDGGGSCGIYFITYFQKRLLVVLNLPRFDSGSGVTEIATSNRVKVGRWNVVEVRRKFKQGWVALNDDVVTTSRGRVGGLMKHFYSA